MRQKTIHRSHLTKNFTTLPNELLQNNAISHLALGLLCRMLSLPPDWETNLEWIYQTRKEGKEGMQTAIRELEALGYLKRSRLRPEGGKMGKMLWEWFDSPTAVIPAAGLTAEGNRPTTKDRVKKGVGSSKASSPERKKEIKGGFVPKRTSLPLSFHRPRHPYPETPEEMEATLERFSIEFVPDYDGNFWEERQRLGWVEPDGTPIYDWVAFYDARTDRSFPGKSVVPIALTTSGGF